MDFTREAFNLQRALFGLENGRSDAALAVRVWRASQALHAISKASAGSGALRPRLLSCVVDQLRADLGRFPKVSSRFVTPEVLVETWENGEIISNVMEDCMCHSQLRFCALKRLFDSMSPKYPVLVFSKYDTNDCHRVRSEFEA